MKNKVLNVTGKVLCSALSAAMIVAFAPAVGWRGGVDNVVAYADTASNSATSQTIEVNDTTTLASAVSQAQAGDIVKLSADVNLIATVTIDKDLTIDLNNHNITAQDNRAIHITAGNVIITGSGTISANHTQGNENFLATSSVIRVGDGVAKTTANVSPTDSSRTNVSLKIDKNVTVSSNWCYGVSAFGTTTETVEVLGTIAVTGENSAIAGSGSKGCGATNITLGNGSKLSSTTGPAVYHPQAGNLYLGSTEISGPCGIEMKAGTTSILSGAIPKVTAAATEKVHVTCGDGPSTTKGYAVVVVKNQAYAHRGTPKAYLTAGTYTGAVEKVTDTAYTDTSNNTVLEITGGTYNADPTTYVDTSGYTVTKSESLYTVALNSQTTNVAQVTCADGRVVQAATLAEAVSVANASTIKLLNDVSLVQEAGAAAVTVAIAKDLTIDLNGHNIAVQDNRAIHITAGNVIITGSGIISANHTEGNTTFDDESSVIRVGIGNKDTSKAATDSSRGNVSLKIDKDVTVSSNWCYGVTAFGATTETLEVLGTIDVTGEWCAISGNGSNGFGATNITLGNGSKLSSKKAPVIYHPQAGNLYLGSTEISGPCGIEMKAGTTSILSGATPKITATATDKVHVTNGNGPSTTSGYAVSIVENQAYVHNGAPKAYLTAGTYTGAVEKVTDEDKQYADTSNKTVLEITGGTFNTQPDEGYLADGYSATYVNGAYTVAPMGHKHKYTSVVNTAATCTSAGSATYTCTGDTEDATSKGCGTSYTSPIAALGHAFSNGSITWTNGGTSAATARFTCQRDATHTQTVNAAVSKTLTINPTCTVGGTNTYTATATSSTGTTVTASKTAQDVPALGHSYGEYTITTAPTTTTTGVATAKCTRTGCTSIITKTVEKLDSTQSATTAGGTSVEVTVDDAKPTTTPDGTQVVGGVTVSELVSTTAKEVTIPQTVTLDGAEYAVTAVDKSAFEGNTTVTSVTLPDTVTSIPEGLFEGCTSLESVTLPETLKEIPSNTFSGTAITSITIPATVTTIGDGAFAGTSLESVDVSSAKSIGSDTFKDCSSLKTVDVSSAETIGSEAFKGCTALESVDVSSATTIGSDTFAGCSKLESVNVSAATSIGNDAFKGCTALESVDVSSATTIGSSTFSGCSALTTVDVSSATSIGNGAFAGCSSLESVNVSAATSIGSGTFSGCNALKSVDVSSAKSIGSSAFKGCSTLKTIDVSAAKTIDSSAFSGCSKLFKVSATKVTTVESSAFKNCSSLTTIKLTNVKTIGANAFSGASKLKTLTTGSSLKGIGAKALSGASKVKTLTITSKKLTKASIKNALKGSSVSTIKVKVSGSKKTQAKYVAAYAKIFSKSNCGKKVTVK